MKKFLTFFMMFLLLLSFSACREQEASPEIPALTYETSAKSYRISERYNPTILSVNDVQNYESQYAIYHFDANVTPSERDKCVYYADQIFSRMGVEEKPQILVMAGYEGAWTEGACTISVTETLLLPILVHS